jgi:hypothetical protein
MLGPILAPGSAPRSSPIGLFAGHLFVWIRTAPFAMLTPPQARRSEPGGAVTHEGPVDMDGNASFAGEVERYVMWDSDFSLRGQLHSNAPLHRCERR